VYDLQTFYKGKKVLITGHTGFKGSWLSLVLIELGAEVIGYSLNPKSSEDLFVVAHIDELITDYRGDIRDSGYLKSTMIKHQPEIIFHLAAQPLVIESYKNPHETWEINVMGTINLIENARNIKSVKSIVIVTTDKVYKNDESLSGYSEKDPLGGHDPYSSSKAAVELLVESFRSSFFENKEDIVGIATARAGNVIGGGDWAENRLIPDYFRAYFSDKDFEFRNPHSIRPWQHVLDVSFGYILLAKMLYTEPRNFSSSFNFSNNTSNDITTSFIVQYLKTKLPKVNVVDESSKIEFKETIALRLLSTKAYNHLGWKTLLSIEESLDYTINYYLDSVNKSPRQLLISQIRKYLEGLT
jgi:CDP-glucose 4,6-dehydratase